MARSSVGSPKSSEITPESVFINRRRVLKSAAVAIAGAGLSGCGEAKVTASPAEPAKDSLEVTPESIATSFNNFWEFGSDKGDPKKYAHELTIAPWQVKVSGKVAKKGKFDIEDLLRGHTPEDRIYRFRCVEAWSMVVPWRGIPLASLLKDLDPHGDAKYVEFTTLHRPSEMRGQRSVFSNIDWPYVEGLRMDEAMHPLTLMVVGAYGKPLPNQNGAPWRLIVPWKYGFKSIKSIAKIRLTSRQPKNTWQLQNPREYGFYSNVNPDVSHPRWSQATERRLPSTVFNPNRIETLPFNGYGEEVASLYAGMDLSRFI